MRLKLAYPCFVIVLLFVSAWHCPADCRTIRAAGMKSIVADNHGAVVSGIATLILYSRPEFTRPSFDRTQIFKNILMSLFWEEGASQIALHLDSTSPGTHLPFLYKSRILLFYEPPPSLPSSYRCDMKGSG